MVEWLVHNHRIKILLLHTSDPKTIAKQGMLIDPRLHQQSWSSLMRKGGRKLPPKDDWHHWWVTGDDKEFERIRPFRTGKDKAIRLSRARDWWRIYHQKPPAHYQDVLNLGWDYITTLNLLYTIELIPDFYPKFEKVGAFDDDIEWYVKTAKRVNDAIKTYGLIDEPHPERFVEAATLTGYRNPPYPGFDVIKEAKALADGGLDFSFPITSFKDMTKKQLMQTPIPAKWIGFDDWVRSAQWQTSGASTLGRLVIDTPDGPVKLKCRKNQVIDAIGLDQLAQQARAATDQVNFTILKSELGKIRLAVSSDIYTYLKMMWVLRYVNKAYLMWPDTSLNETVIDTLARMERTLASLRGRFGLPYDYAAFDHQITTSMLETMWDALANIGSLAIVPANQAEYQDICRNVHNTFGAAQLYTKVDMAQICNKITGGLPSGLAITSIVGNGWNLIMTSLAKELLTALHFKQAVHTDIRGDDSNLIHDDWRDASAMNECYAAIGAVGGQGKYAIRWQQTEFLRVSYTDVCSGYPMRALPGIVQRKPWNNSPWSDVSTIEHHHTIISILTRRGLNCDRLWRGLRGIWCQLHQVPVAALATPRHLGGLGLENGPFNSWPHMAAPSHSSHIVRKTTERERILSEHFTNTYNITLTAEQATTAAQKASDATLAADDVPAVSKFARKQFKEIARKHFRIAPSTRRPHYAPVTEMTAVSARELPVLLDLWKRDAPTFGRYPEITTILDDARVVGDKPTQFLKTHRPHIYDLVSTLKKRFGTQAAIDYIAGKITMPFQQLHPIASSLALAHAMRSVGPYCFHNKLDPRTVTYDMTPMFEHAWLTSPLTKKLLKW